MEYIIVGAIVICAIHLLVVGIDNIINNRISLHTIAWVFLIIVTYILYKWNPLGL
jgi:hypothetical protein